MSRSAARAGSAASHSGYLLDTSVLSALAPAREAYLPAGFAQWLHARTERLFIPSIAVAELEQGICKLRRAGGRQRAARLSGWVDGLVAGFGERILSLDAATARAMGRLSDAAVAKGKYPGFADVAIAAMAKEAGLFLLTRDLKHFEPLGVACGDPMVRLPD